jgi:hypothetical protein
MDGNAARREYAVTPKRCRLATLGAQHLLGPSKGLRIVDLVCMTCAMCVVYGKDCPDTSHISGPKTNSSSRLDSNRRDLAPPEGAEAPKGPDLGPGSPS